MKWNKFVNVEITINVYINAGNASNQSPKK